MKLQKFIKINLKKCMMKLILNNLIDILLILYVHYLKKMIMIHKQLLEMLIILVIKES